MAKRNGHFAEAKNKKTKIDRGTDILWNDDDFDNIDECLILATQQCEKSSLVPMANGNSTLNYSNVFDNTNANVYTSTQVIGGNKVERLQSTNRSAVGDRERQDQEHKIKQLEAQIKTLTEKIECKNGEVSILRTQIKELKVHLEQEHQKYETQHLQEIGALNKERLAIKSQLDFKNLEIVNLKNAAKYTMLQSQQDFKNATMLDRNGVYKLYTIFDARYPLTELITRNVLHCDKTEGHLLDVCGSGTMQEHGADDFFSIKQSSTIRNIMETLKHALSLFHNCLEIREHYIRNKNGQYYAMQEGRQTGTCAEDVRITRSGCIGDLERRAAQLVEILAKIFPYAYSLRKALLNSTNLNLIRRILGLIRRTKTSDIFSGFLCAVAELLLKISQTEDVTRSQCPSPVLDTFKELLQTRPPVIVLTKQLLFLKQVSEVAIFQFGNAFCKVFETATSSHLPVGDNVLTEQDNCLLQSLALLCQNRMPEADCFDMNLSEGILQLTMICLNYNVFCYQPDSSGSSHNCICKLIVLAVNVIHTLVNSFKRNNLRHISNYERERYTAAFRYCVRILHIIGFKYFDMINKYFVDSQYKYIVNYLYLSRNVLGLTEFQDEALRDLNIHEDICHINSADFDKIPVWH